MQPANVPCPPPPPQPRNCADADGAAAAAAHAVPAQPQRAAPFGTGSFDEPQAPAAPARRGIYGLLAVAVVAIAGTVYWYNSNVKPGRIELTTTPGDATVLIDNVKVGDHSPVSLEKPPGPYTLSVTRDGYARNDQNIELKAGQPLSLTVALEPSPDTGFELTSDPPGGLVWLDGAAVKEAAGTAGAHQLPRVAHQPRAPRARDPRRAASSPGSRTSRSSRAGSARSTRR